MIPSNSFSAGSIGQEMLLVRLGESPILDGAYQIRNVVAEMDLLLLESADEGLHVLGSAKP